MGSSNCVAFSIFECEKKMISYIFYAGCCFFCQEKIHDAMGILDMLVSRGKTWVGKSWGHVLEARDKLLLCGVHRREAVQEEEPKAPKRKAAQSQSTGGESAEEPIIAPHIRKQSKRGRARN